MKLDKLLAVSFALCLGWPGMPAPRFVVPHRPGVPGKLPGASRPSPAAQQNFVSANPSNYLKLLRRLRPGETLVLEPGIYNNPNEVPGLPIFDLNGEPEKPIVITGPERGPRPILQARSTHNTVRIANSSYVVIRNLELDGRDLDVDAVKGQGPSHQITLENLLIRNHGADQQTVGISTKAPAWDWTVRNCVIRGAGTGMYFGNSDGSAPFVRGLIENNLIVDTLGYNLQIKHQNPRPALPGMPTTPGATIIRRNVFSKAENGSTGDMARPNVLVGHFPPAGPGVDDVYEIYGNFFYQNPTGEALFQGEGNIALYNNIFFNSRGDAIRIQPHYAFPRNILVFYNTVVAREEGITVRGGSNSHRQRVIANVVFASAPIQALNQNDNVTGTFEAASQYLTHPFGPLGQLDLFPKPGKLNGRSIETNLFRNFPEWNVDFNGNPRSGTVRGAYAGGARNPSWLPRLEVNPVKSPPIR